MAFGLGWMLAGGTATAEGSLAAACALDFQLFCEDLDPESPRAAVVACLEKNDHALTEECRGALDPASIPRPSPANRNPVNVACDADFERLCGDERDRMSFIRCIRNRYDQLAPACQEIIDRRGAGPPGGGRGGRRGPGGPPGPGKP